MRAEDFEYLYALEERYWWFTAMRRITDTIVREQLARKPLHVLDAGCGTGYNLRHYEDGGHIAYGFDIAAEAVDGVRRRGFTRIAQGSVTGIPFRPGFFDLVFSFDVICQIPEDSVPLAIAEMHRVLKPGGFLFVRVPAFEWLRSSHDADLHTFHRFTRTELERRLKAAGFSLHYSTYANSLLFPVVVLRRFLKRFGIGGGTDVKPLPAGLQWIDPVFRGVLGSERRVIESGRSFPFGLSVICYARKADERTP